MDPFSPARDTMVERDLARRGIQSTAVLNAMRAVPRHRFVPASETEHAYADEALSLSEGQTISQPYIVALMLEEARIAHGDVVLEVGTGSGYAAAVAAELAAEVFTIERRPQLAARAVEALKPYPNVEVKCGDGTLGWNEHAPYDAILVAAAGADVPGPLLHQLAIGGRLVMPLEGAKGQRLVRVTRLDTDAYQRDDLIAVRFVPLIPGVLS